MFVSVIPDIVIGLPRTSEDSIWMSWSNPYHRCSNEEYEYQLYRESDGQLVRSNVTTESGFTIYDLRCDSKFRLRVRYRTRAGTKEKWFSAQTNLPRKYKCISGTCLYSICITYNIL